MIARGEGEELRKEKKLVREIKRYKLSVEEREAQGLKKIDNFSYLK